MKELKNEAFASVLGNDAKFDGTYAELGKAVVNAVAPGSGGITTAQVLARLRVLAVLNAAEPDGVMLFEDADAVTLQECTKGMRWAVVAQPIADFCAAVENMKAPEPEAKELPPSETEPKA